MRNNKNLEKFVLKIEADLEKQQLSSGYFSKNNSSYYEYISQIGYKLYEIR